MTYFETTPLTEEEIAALRAAWLGLQSARLSGARDDTLVALLKEAASLKGERWLREPLLRFLAVADETFGAVRSRSEVNPEDQRLIRL